MVRLSERDRKKLLVRKLAAERERWLLELARMRRWLEKHQSGKNSSPL
jgi:hypothetical protein